MEHIFTEADNRMLKAVRILEVDEIVHTDDTPLADEHTPQLADGPNVRRMVQRLTERDLEINTRDAAIRWCEEAQQAELVNQVLMEQNFELANQNAALRRTVRRQSLYLVYAAVMACMMAWLVMTQ
jgi:flagellar biosynthesis/type III secretory pathway chaperone